LPDGRRLLGVPEDKIISPGRYRRGAIGRGTYAAQHDGRRQALRAAADEVIERGSASRAFPRGRRRRHHLCRRQFHDCRHRSGMPIQQVARCRSSVGSRRTRNRPHGRRRVRADVPSFPNGCHICEVELDPETGAVVLDAMRRRRYRDRRQPLLAKGQIMGGVAQGAGQALVETSSMTPRAANC